MEVLPPIPVSPPSSYDYPIIHEKQSFPSRYPIQALPCNHTWFSTNFILLMGFTIVVVLFPLIYCGEISPDTFYLTLVIIAIAIALFSIWARLYYDSM